MSWAQVRVDEVVPQPWRNGGGVTRELLAWPDATPWRVRVSIADITRDGPFSRFDGIERWFAVLEGAGVRLEVAGHGHRLDPRSRPLRFDGAADCGAWLADGPTRDFNLMAPPGAASLRRVEGAITRELPAGALVGAYSHAAPARIACGDPVEIAAGVFAWQRLQQADEIRVEGDGVLWLEVLT